MATTTPASQSTSSASDNVYTEADVAAMHQRGDVLPAVMLVRRERDGNIVRMLINEGARITRPENHGLVTPGVRRALVALADLVEYHRLGDVNNSSGDDHGLSSSLSGLIDDGRAFYKAHEAELRALVAPRLARLEAWLALPAHPLRFEPPGGGKGKLWDRTRRERVEEAEVCARVLRRAGFA